MANIEVNDLTRAERFNKNLLLLLSSLTGTDHKEFDSLKNETNHRNIIEKTWKASQNTYLDK